jgi:hypothetical protein
MKRMSAYKYSIFLFVLLSCHSGNDNKSIISIHKIADCPNVWCFYLDGHIYNSFLDTTLYLKNGNTICSHSKPELRTEYSFNVKVDPSSRIHFDSAFLSNDCNGRYCIVFDAVIVNDTCCAYVLYPPCMIGEYSFSLSKTELAFVSLLFSYLSDTNYVKTDYKTNERNMRFSMLSLYKKHHVSYTLVNMLSPNIDTNVSLCMDAVESIICRHINNSEKEDTNSTHSKYRIIFNSVLQENGIGCNFPDNPPPSI